MRREIKMEEDRDPGYHQDSRDLTQEPAPPYTPHPPSRDDHLPHYEQLPPPQIEYHHLDPPEYDGQGMSHSTPDPTCPPSRDSRRDPYPRDPREEYRRHPLAGEYQERQHYNRDDYYGDDYYQRDAGEIFMF